MTKQFGSLFAVTLVFLAGCMSAQPLEPRMAFPVAEYQALPAPNSGTAVVKGQTFLRTVGGDVKFGAGSVVMLNPKTSYSDEWYAKAYVHGRNIGNSDDRLDDYLIKTVADGEGRFAFSRVPAGRYYLTTVVTWAAPTGYQGALQQQGGVISLPISVDEGDVLEVVLTR